MTISLGLDDQRVLFVQWRNEIDKQSMKFRFDFMAIQLLREKPVFKSK